VEGTVETHVDETEKVSGSRARRVRFL
jgi:hypothetical protein